MNKMLRKWKVKKMKTRFRYKRRPQLYGPATKASPNAPYSVVSGNLRKFTAIPVLDAEVALIQGAHEQEAKEMGS